ncbi:hypothetical protein [Phenylobacterium sp.]|uniref:hypothetical protein n=1 Tax=Phenylobacterium sp. TaxID=1871053 RepID=UPI0025F9BF7B|nr:hypothetical protein [Phenylobacterium sp.]MCA6226390.1 hypothetical protein [Phenylobacterium sp.]MCA6253342.1 hypothetical protein [Phenylobacterium sp.]MCA6275816.1 hypothetical protein [Phenylobacterium sp.]MCA6302352.1 hypothetical protein [Phenylobacterium sp.]MCA6303641.1 hypothetical protein [Phenylobacterium sp.]
MSKLIRRVFRITVAVFLAACVVILVVQVVWITPGQECEQAGKWWDWRTRTCAQPILISDITGRPITDRKSHDAAKADAQARKAEALGAAKPE